MTAEEFAKLKELAFDAAAAQKHLLQIASLEPDEAQRRKALRTADREGLKAEAAARRLQRT